MNSQNINNSKRYLNNSKRYINNYNVKDSEKFPKSDHARTLKEEMFRSDHVFKTSLLQIKVNK